MRNLIILNPSTITGLTDGDGSFYISISPSIKNLTGWSVSINFQIVANTNNANLEMLEKVKLFFGVGNISKNKLDNTVRYTVSGLKNCKVIQQHFLDYPLMTYKLVYFQLWCSVLELIEKGEHLTLNGLLKIVGFKAPFKMGLSKAL